MSADGAGRAADLTRAAVLTSRYSGELTHVAATAVGDHGAGNRDVELLLAINDSRGITPGDLAARMGLARSAISRSLARFRGDGLIARVVDPADRRSAKIHLTPKGRRCVRVFQSRLADFFVSSAPLAKEIVDLLRQGPEPRAPAPDAGMPPLAVVEVMARWGGAFVDAVGPVMRDHGLRHTVDRYALLAVHERGEIRPSQLADGLHLSTGAVTEVIDRLEAAHLVERSRLAPGGDRRAVVLRATPAGVAAAAAMLGVFAQHAAGLCDVLALAVLPGASAPAPVPEIVTISE